MSVDILNEIKINDSIFETDKSVITGKDLLKIVGEEPPNDFVIYLLLDNGDMRSIHQAEEVDLQRSGIDEFRTFRSDAIFLIEIDGILHEWGSNLITGRAIKRLSGNSDPEGTGIWHKLKNGEDSLIEDCDLVDLTCGGVEKFSVGAKFTVCIEGKTFEWYKKTITTEEIIRLGGWDASQGAVEVDREQNERPLASGEVIELKPGHNFCKRQRFKRGFDKDSRIGKEVLLLRKNYIHVEYKEVNNLHWFKVDDYPLPSPLAPRVISVVFSVTAGHPVPKPYGFYVPNGIKYGEQILNLNNPQYPPPFDGSWRFVSWDVENWRPGADVTTGDNLWGWVRSFRARLLEGE